MEKFDLRVILVVIGVLTLVTGIVTEILKKVFWQVVPSSLLAVLVAEGLTLASGFAYAQLAGTVILWYHVIAAIVAGRGVAYTAMYGYDKHVEIRRELKEKRGGKT